MNKQLSKTMQKRKAPAFAKAEQIARRLCFASGALLLSLNAFQAKADGIGYGNASIGQLNVSGIQNTNAAAPMFQYAYVYVKEGESLSYRITRSFGGPAANTMIYSVFSPTGQIGTAETIPGNQATIGSDTIVATAQTAGIWTIRMQITGVTARWRFDANALDASAARIPGRVYTETIYMYQDAAINVPLYVSTVSGHKYDVMLSGYNGIASTIASDQFGITSKDNCQSLYRSAEASDATIRQPSDPQCGVFNKLFFSPIDPTLPAAAPKWDIASGQTVSEWIQPALTGPVVSGLAYAAVGGSNPLAGNFSLNVADHVGQATLQLDLDNDGSYNGPNDRSIPFSVADANTVSVPFDGLNGSGAVIPAGSSIKAKVLVDKAGEVHFTMNDVEVLGGFKVTRTTGDPTGSTLLYWNDANLTETGKTSVTPQKDGTAGVDTSAGGVHGWANVGADQWGNNRMIDNWTYAGAAATQEITVESCAANAGTISR